jgi:hypothetical protein
MARQAVVKYQSRVKRALEMKQGDDLWIVLGKTSAWADEAIPDTPLPGDITIVEPIVAIKVVTKYLATEITESAYLLLAEVERAAVVIDETMVYLQLVADEDAYTAAARYLYLKVTYDPIIEAHPSFTSFRVYYATSALVPSAGYENASWLAPANIDDYGLVEYENSGLAILGGTAISLPIVIEFR